ncbi:MAG: hypothetical protein KJ709_05580 [Nanoarchaeota archaeon]|nr:hypothetical protein [Nanoarchaeota archaeon]
MRKNLLEQVVFYGILLLGLYVTYQIIKILLGGSWAVEDVILALLIFNLGLSGMILRTSTGNMHDIKHLDRGFKALAKDFKDHRDLVEKHLIS